jgi:toxin ParE1/3/4
MDYKVLISPRARDDLRSITEFIARHQREAAVGFSTLLVEKALSLNNHPLRGRVVPEINNPSVRELVFKSYRIIFQISEQSRSVAVLRFWHAARGTPEIG